MYMYKGVLALVLTVHFVPYCSSSIDDGADTRYTSSLAGHREESPALVKVVPLLVRHRRQAVAPAQPAAAQETNGISAASQNQTVAAQQNSSTATPSSSGNTTVAPSPATGSGADSSAASNATTTTTTTVTSTTSTTAAPASADEGTSYEELDSFTEGEHPIHINGTNITKIQIDDHKYYVSEYVPPDRGDAYWVDLQARPTADVITHDMLSEAHRRAARVPLSFEFPFYGHLIHNITIATGGFLYTGDYLHSWLAATQYIAPLMANFDTTASLESVIKYSDNGTSLTVQWEKVPLQEANNTAFTFQVTIHKTGDVVFAYRDIPVNISGIQTAAHPVKVGMSDAYIIDRIIFYVKRKTIYEYHRINMKDYPITSHSAVLFHPLPTCISLNTCEKCLSHPNIKFKCGWCASTGHCSDGVDRRRQNWLDSRCDNSYYVNLSQCSTPPPTQPTQPAAVSTQQPDKAAASNAAPAPAASVADKGESAGGMSSSTAATVAIVLILVVALGGWVLYAYMYPHSTSGQILIRYRPSRWRMRRGEARYTAASIHM